MAFFGIVLVFGLMNCILGYRLLRFWMMLFGFLIGAGIWCIWSQPDGNHGQNYLYCSNGGCWSDTGGDMPLQFLKPESFLLVQELGLSVTIYVIHPTTSFTFFLCLLAGVGLGILALRFEREVIIVGTSLLGGILVRL